MTATGLERALAVLQPFFRVVQELGPLASDPEACDFLAGNPEQPALPGYVETLPGRFRASSRRPPVALPGPPPRATLRPP